MKKCFVIQPFDNGKFDKRYQDVFEPAIKKAGFAPYRVDKDFSVQVPIEEIEKGIRECSLCFAEITTDNPNVWYELGYSLACNKDVVMVCSDEREGNFPFDIRHRQIIIYNTGSKSDFEALEKNIVLKINALSRKIETAEKLNKTPIVETEGLKSHEIAILIMVTNYSIANTNGISIWYLNDEMEKSGYTNIATSVGIKTLENMGMVTTEKAIDEWNNNAEYIACKLTTKGEKWILQNQDKFEFRNSKGQMDDLPF